MHGALKQAGSWLFYGVVIALSFSVISWWQTRDMLSTSGEVTIPNIALPLLSGGTQQLAPGQDDRPTLVYFFAPWCSICRMSIGNLADIDEQQTRIAVIALDYESIDAVQDFVDEVEVDRPVMLGNQQIRELFRIKGYPSYYILDADFKVISRDMGYSSSPGLQARLWGAQS